MTRYVRISFLALILSWIGVAQLPTGQITGIVTDSTGATVAGVDVEAQNIATGIVSKAATSASGDYTFPVLTPGKYTLVVRKAGFESITRTGIDLEVSQVARIDFTLKVGSTREMVEVKATTPLLDSATASLGQVIETRAVS
ncbi:MAG TPA: carboxypeptidase-like regulatory domain-containing protein, partial [Bryobacteraceae bacterium]